MTVEEIKTYCKSKHKATEEFPFGDVPICYKLNGKISFTQDEITKLTRQYKLTGEDIINIFVGKTDEGGEHDEPI